MRRAASRISTLAVTLVACACGISTEDRNTIEKAMETIEQAPERVRTEVLRTCDKWMHSRRACDEEAVHLAQMECWLEMGLPHLKSALKRNLRQRRRDSKTMQHQNVCMEKRGWRFREPTKDYF